MIQAEKGHNSPKLEEKKFVLNWHLDNNKLALSCAKLRPAYTSYPLVFG